MPVIPSIQSLVGAHSAGGAIGASIAVDWARNAAFESNNTYLSKYGILTGLEQNYITMSSVGGGGGCVGLAANGNIFIPGPGTLYAGATLYLDGTALTVNDTIAYTAPNFGGGGMVGVTVGSSQWLVDQGPGNNIISTLNIVNEISTTNWLASQGFAGVGGKSCAGPAGTGIAYVISAVQTGPSQVGPAVLSKIVFDGAGGVTNTVIGNITMASIDAGWTGQFQIQGCCLDQTDNKILAVFSGAGNSNKAYIAKINPTSAAVVWKTVIPATDGGGPLTVGQVFSYSDIRHQRVGFYTGSPATATIYNTATGAIDTTYTSGLAGLHPYIGTAYNDTLGASVIITDFTQGVGSPTLLNSTPSSWGAGWAVLYLAAGITPPTSPNRRYLGGSGPIRSFNPPPPPISVKDRTTQADELRTTMNGNIRTLLP